VRAVPELDLDPAVLLDGARARMPFGKYEGWKLMQLPEAYLVWFSRSGFPAGKLGKQLALVLELKANGLEPLIAQLMSTAE